MDECIFCRIAAGRAKSDIVYQDEKVVAFHDIRPIAPVHVIIIPREHIARVADLTDEQLPIVGHMVSVANKLARQEKIENGYRLVINNGREGGQKIFHLHMHLIGGRLLSVADG